MVVIAAIALGFATLGLAFCAYLYLELQKRPYGEAMRSQLTSYSEELNKTYAANFRAIETEWTDMYQKFSRLAGRMDRQKYLDSPTAKEEAPLSPAMPLTRSEILRRSKNK